MPYKQLLIYSHSCVPLNKMKTTTVDYKLDTEVKVNIETNPKDFKLFVYRNEWSHMFIFEYHNEIKQAKRNHVK